MSDVGIPETQDGLPVWTYSAQGVEIRFTGRGVRGSRDTARLGAGVRRPCAWARQTHSKRVLTARPGNCGEGDALVTAQSGLALAVAVADCVPVAVWGRGKLALVHAGWRGIASEIVPAALESLEVPPPELKAWIGPAMGVCCYEVGSEVAEAVAAASAEEAIVRHEGSGRLTLNLRLAVDAQLRAAGVPLTDDLPLCTGCDSERLWSYRRMGVAAGRNYAFAWIPEQARS